MGDIAVVAGAGGFVGSHLARYLAEMGMQVIGLDRRPFSMSQVISKVVDLTNRKQVLEALNDCSPRWVFNLTGAIDHTVKWPEQRTIVEQHWLSVLNLVEALDGRVPEAFVNVGSSDEYGDQPAPQIETMREMPIAPYSAAKVAATHYLQMCHRRSGFPAVVARFFLVYGPGQDTQRLIPWACSSLLRGDIMPATEGSQLRDFLYVQDAVRGLVALAASPETRGEVFNVASGEPVTVRELLQNLQDVVGSGEVDFGARPMRSGEIMALYADIRRIREVTGWQPTIDLREGLRRTVDSYRHGVHQE